MILALNVNGLACNIFSCVPKSNPKKGITIVKENKEKTTLKIFEKIFNPTYE